MTREEGSKLSPLANTRTVTGSSDAVGVGEGGTLAAVAGRAVACAIVGDGSAAVTVDCTASVGAGVGLAVSAAAVGSAVGDDAEVAVRTPATAVGVGDVGCRSFALEPQESPRPITTTASPTTSRR